MKSNVIILYACLFYLFTGCTSISDKNEIKKFIGELKNKLANEEHFEESEYFTDKGWETFSDFFKTQSGFEFFSKQKIRKIKSMGESKYHVLLGEYDPAAGGFGLVLIKEFDSFKVSEYLAGR